MIQSQRPSANELAQKLQSAELTAVGLLEQCLDKIDGLSQDSVFINVTRTRALREARASDERRQRGYPLGLWDGLPVVWKDLFDVKGEVTTAGSIVYRDAEPASKDADVVDAASRQGLVCLGKTNLSEFAYSGLGLNPHYGTPGNPAKPDEAYAPGGSSAGSAVAVASGLAPIGIGSDTAGSVRVPASFCGIVGFKASQNRYSKQGCFPLSSSLDSFGGFGNTVEDVIQIDSIMRGKAVAEAETTELGKLDFLIPETVVFDDVEPAVLDCFEKFVRSLQNCGASVRRESFPIFSEVAGLFQEHGTLTVAEAATFHSDLLSSDRANLMDQRVRERMNTASQYSVSDYIRLQWARERLERQVSKELNGASLLFPTTAITAPRIDELEASGALFKRLNLMALRNTMLGSYLGTPGVSLPIGVNDSGLPIGALISAPNNMDEKVLAVARAVEMSICRS